ncbi:hypothetical protein AVEN_42422-1 [Araneus ventricosus]|uniref:Uncharacterized protein n=1 Tax=Araneus ventricosus TaxID=182803 RepID=A0A4Y2IMQ6_ARAVE|nr:hypothetical protein AVEN_42422-1 [Araneus ventricosus]
MPRRSEDAFCGVVRFCNRFSEASEVIIDESEPIEVGRKRSMFGEENCIFPNPVEDRRLTHGIIAKTWRPVSPSSHRFCHSCRNSIRKVALIKDLGNWIEGWGFPCFAVSLAS